MKRLALASAAAAALAIAATFAFAGISLQGPRLTGVAPQSLASGRTVAFAARLPSGEAIDPSVAARGAAAGRR